MTREVRRARPAGHVGRARPVDAHRARRVGVRAADVGAVHEHGIDAQFRPAGARPELEAEAPVAARAPGARQRLARAVGPRPARRAARAGEVGAALASRTALPRRRSRRPRRRRARARARARWRPARRGGRTVRRPSRAPISRSTPGYRPHRRTRAKVGTPVAWNELARKFARAARGSRPRRARSRSRQRSAGAPRHRPRRGGARRRAYARHQAGDARLEQDLGAALAAVLREEDRQLGPRARLLGLRGAGERERRGGESVGERATDLPHGCLVRMRLQ